MTGFYLLKENVTIAAGVESATAKGFSRSQFSSTDKLSS